MKKLIFNKETKIIEAVECDDGVKAETEDKTKADNRRDTISCIISSVSVAISIGALIVGCSQVKADEKQADISIRQLELDKKPVFECCLTEEDLYDEEAYWGQYVKWLTENDIKNFSEWQAQEFPESDIERFDTGQSRAFWDAYDEDDAEALNDMTDGAYGALRHEYGNYLSDKRYYDYDLWRSFYAYKKDHITLKNIGANITNAYLSVVTFAEYHVEIGDVIDYRFGIDMNGHVFSSYWEGYYSSSWGYDAGNNTFTLEYTQDVPMDEQCYGDLNGLIEYLWSDEFLNEIGIGSEDAVCDEIYIDYYTPVYFKITYWDGEKEEQTDWYRYNILTDSLYYQETYPSDVEVPDITKEDMDVCFQMSALHTAQVLGYQNAEWKSLYWEDDSYIEESKEKIIADLKALIGKAGGVETLNALADL